MRSYSVFQRWSSQEHKTWQFEIYKKYNKELTDMLIAFKASKKFTYKQLTVLGGTFPASADDYFNFDDPTHVGNFKTIKDWSNTYNNLSKWIYLNALVAITSNFELYLSSIIKLSLDSDPGLIVGDSQAIDGMKLKKHNKNKINYDQYVIGCVKGTWDSRLKNLENLFNTKFEIISNNLSQLEHMRSTRNDIAHAFGRSLKETENHEVLNPLALPNMTFEKLLNYQIILFKITETIDSYLLKNHIGQYQIVLYYYLWLQKNKRSNNFRKDLGRFRNRATKKEYVKDLKEYYSNL